jgi:hypothetical protein
VDNQVYIYVKAIFDERRFIYKKAYSLLVYKKDNIFTGAFLVSKDKSYFRFTIQRQNIILTEETQLFTTTYFYEKGL